MTDQPAARRTDARSHVAHRDDPQYHVQVELLRDMLALADQAMERERIPEQTRDRVIWSVLHDGLDEEQAVQRLQDQAAAVRLAMLTPGRIPATEELQGLLRDPSHTQSAAVPSAPRDTQS